MIDINQYIADFLRDAQYRIAEIGVSLDDLDDFDSPEYKELESQRLELYQFMAILYVGEWSIIDGYNHLDWEEYDIKQEAEYLRNRTGMITSPFTTFVGNYPEVAESISGVLFGTGIPAGTNTQYVGYDENGNPIAAEFPPSAGMNDTDTALTFFA